MVVVTGGQLAEIGGVGGVAVVKLSNLLCWVWEVLLGLVWRFSVVLLALCSLAGQLS